MSSEHSTYYHAFNKNISSYEILRDDQDCLRMLGIFNYYRFSNRPEKYSCCLDIPMPLQQPLTKESKELVRIHAYCLMPTHFHLLLEETEIGRISDYLRVCLNAYTRYFNSRYGRKGPLWQNRSKRVAVGKDEAFLAVSRYVHLNPVTAYLVERPQDWQYSSYNAYASPFKDGADMLLTKDNIKMSHEAYRLFVEDYKDNARKSAEFKKLFLD